MLEQHQDLPGALLAEALEAGRLSGQESPAIVVPVPAEASV